MGPFLLLVACGTPSPSPPPPVDPSPPTAETIPVGDAPAKAPNDDPDHPWHVILVVDITASWGHQTFDHVRRATLAAYDTMMASDAVQRIGLVTFHGMYGTELTPLRSKPDLLVNGTRGAWAGLGMVCQRHARDEQLAQMAASELPTELCPAVMPWQLPDEAGTDHSVGLETAVRMFLEQGDSNARRAMVLITDGKPIGVGPHQMRDELGFVEDRWRTVVTQTRRETKEAIAASIEVAEDARETLGVHTWVISYDHRDRWIVDVTQGRGAVGWTDDADKLDELVVKALGTLSERPRRRRRRRRR